jgi:hypothetical protein
MDEPMRRLLAAAGGEDNRVVIQKIGSSWEMPPSSTKETDERSTGVAH